MSFSSTNAAIKRDTVLPSLEVLAQAREKLVSKLPQNGVGETETRRHLTEDIVPALNLSSISPNYYGFVTGGATPAAALADNIVTQYDQNVQVHLPEETIATEVEDKALRLLCSLLDLKPDDFPHRTFTTGATASNIIGLACGREYVVTQAALKLGLRADEVNVGRHGLLRTCKMLGIEDINILTTAPHSSLRKAASLIGLGASSVKLVNRSDAPHRIDLAKLREELDKSWTVNIVAISCAEVNTGFFATTGLDEMIEIRKICDEFGAWIHVDAAFGAMGRLLKGQEYLEVIKGSEGLELANSITGDGHKLLNVPYDCGFIFSGSKFEQIHAVQNAIDVFQNPGAAYLGGVSTGIPTIPSPLHIGIENSRRFRALPVYASLIAYGEQGYRDIIERQIRLARSVAQYIINQPELELLPKSDLTDEQKLAQIYIIVLFKAKDKNLNAQLVKKINATRRVYVSGTSWDDEPACRFAISNWQVDVERDLNIIKGVLEEVVSVAKSE